MSPPLLVRDTVMQRREAFGEDGQSDVRLFTIGPLPYFWRDPPQSKSPSGVNRATTPSGAPLVRHHGRISLITWANGKLSIPRREISSKYAKYLLRSHKLFLWTGTLPLHVVVRSLPPVATVIPCVYGVPQKESLNPHKEMSDDGSKQD